MLRSFDGLWRDRDFLAFWSAQSLSLLGIQLGRMALPMVAILSLHADAAEVGLLLAVAGAPWLVFGWCAGIVIDRLPRRPVMIAVHIGRGVLLASVPVSAVLGVATMEQLYLVAFLAGTLGVCFQIAYRAYVPSLIAPTRLPEAYAKLAVTDGVMRTAGPSVAGGVVQVSTATAALGLQAFGYLISGTMLLLIRRPESGHRAPSQESVWSSLRAGLSFVWRQKLIRALTLSEATYLFAFAVVYGMQLVFFTRELHLSAGIIGLIFALGGMGGVVGGVAARRIGNWLTTGRAIIGGSLLRGIGIALVPLAFFAGPLAVPLLVAARLINAFGWTLWEVHQETTQQLRTPPSLRGRVNGIVLLTVHGAQVVGGLAGSGLAALIGVVPTLTIGSSAALLGTVWLARAGLWTTPGQKSTPVG